ncbi:MAG TPA: YjgP/YjgQ family permease [Planctomycetes bacterium]|nr:YjgP/YjgQ family permease [Planctomycetota bacterium]
MILWLYLGRRLLTALGIAVVELAGILLPPIAVSAVSRLGGVGPSVLMGYIPYLLVEIAPYVVPLAFLLAVLRSFGSLGEDREWTAIQMAGIHPLRIFVPGLVLVLPLVGLGVWCLGSVFPSLRYQQHTYQNRAAVEKLKDLLPGRTSIQLGDLSLVARRRAGADFEEVLVRIPVDGRVKRLAADRAVASFVGESLAIRFEGAHLLDQEAATSVDELTVSIPFSELTRYEPPSRLRSKYLGNAALREAVASGEVSPKHHTSYLFEAARREALALSFLVFLLIGIPAGLWLNREAHVKSMLVAMGIFALYYVLSTLVGENLVLSGALPPLVGAWYANAVGILVGLVLIVRVVRR